MRNKPFQKKRRKKQPVVEFIPHIKQVLFLLLRTDSNAYKICQELSKTGFKYKRDWLDAIDYMEKAELVTKEKIPGYSVKRNISLSDIGRTIANLMLNVRRYLESRQKLEASIKSKFDISYMNQERLTELKERYSCYGNKSLKDDVSKITDPVLKHRGWNDNEMRRFTHDGLEPSQGILDLIGSSPDFVISILPYKYRIILEMKPNSTSRTIIQKIIIDLITDVMHYLYAKPFFYVNPYFYGTSESDKITDKVTKDAMDFTESVTRSGALGYRFISKEVTEVLKSIFSLAEPSERALKDRIRFLPIIEEHKLPSPYLDDKLMVLIPFYESLCNADE